MLINSIGLIGWQTFARRPTSSRLPVAGYDLQVIVVCSEGYTSSLAAAALQDLGVRLATDLAGGFLAWKAAGLPVAGGS